MTPDARIDRTLLGAEDTLPLLMAERLEWTYAPASGAELSRLERSLEPGPRALLELEAAWRAIFGGGMAQLLYDAGDRVGEAARAAALVGAPEYEALLEDVAELLPPDGLPEDQVERSERVEDLLDDDEVDGRLEALEERYWELEDEIGSPVDCALRYVRERPEQFFLTELEAAEDLDAFVARLVARAGPVERAGEEDLAAAETELGRPLPLLLRRLYLEVGSGWGPERGFLPLGDLVAAWRRAKRDDRWADTLLPVVAGEGDTICVDAAEPRLRVVRLPAEGPRGVMLPVEATSLRGWLEAWLRA